MVKNRERRLFIDTPEMLTNPNLHLTPVQKKFTGTCKKIIYLIYLTIKELLWAKQIKIIF